MRERLTAIGAPVPSWSAIHDAAALAEFLAAHDGAAVVKTPRGGYDGKGVRVVRAGADAADWFASAGAGEALLAEELVPFTRELAQQVARRPSGEIVAYPLVEWPKPNEVAERQDKTVTLLYSDGSEMGKIASPGQNRTMLTYEEIPDNVKNAVLAAEDANFYDNPGFDAKAIVRAVWIQATGGSSGGSGLTQQYIKKATNNEAPTLTRKFTEVVKAFKMSNDPAKPVSCYVVFASIDNPLNPTALLPDKCDCSRPAGTMLRFMRNRLSGSTRCFTACSRA